MSIIIEDVIESLIKPVGRLEQSVDTLKFGDPQAEVTGIVTTFMPTQSVLEEAVALGANLIISHEGPFFSHHDSFEKIIADDPVYLTKKKFISDSGLAIFRFHDYWHKCEPDGIMEGLIDALAWNPYVLTHYPASSILQFPPLGVREIAGYVKSRLGLSFVRIAGNMDISCKRVGLLAGYRGGGQLAIPLFLEEDLDLIIYGEGPEWETPEYVRDAVQQGRAKALIVLGHAESEEAGMRFLAKRLHDKYPNIPIHFLSDMPIFQVI
jgi:putative NIF3 family GTP cyclohydrolase 1 type 2